MDSISLLDPKAARSNEPPIRPNAQLCFAAIAFANVVCQAIFSVLPTFFPPVAKDKGMSDVLVGVSFAALPAVVFAVSATADKLLGTFGRRPVFIAGNLITACFTAALGAATLLPDGVPFVAFTLSMQVGQGFGSALAETSSYALLAELFPDRVTFYLGMLEAFTGIGVAIGPPLGGVLYGLGGFSLPFVALACALLPGVAFIHVTFGRHAEAADSAEDEGEEGADESSIATALQIPQVLIAIVTCVLAEATLTFVMPTFAEHATAEGLAASPAATGVYFAANAVAYTIAAPLVGFLTSSSNARVMIVSGMGVLSASTFFLGPSPWLRPLLPHHQGSAAHRGVVLMAFTTLGVGEGVTMAPLMEDMRTSCGEKADAYIDSLSGLMAASYALGEMLGPVAGSALAAWLGFNWASTALASTLAVWTGLLFVLSPRLLAEAPPTVKDEPPSPRASRISPRLLKPRRPSLATIVSTNLTPRYGVRRVARRLTVNTAEAVRVAIKTQTSSVPFAISQHADRSPEGSRHAGRAFAFRTPSPTPLSGLSPSSATSLWPVPP